jgi:recombination protein RecA
MAQGGIPIFFDIEQAGAKSVMVACGVDMKRVVYSALTEMEKIFQALEKNLQAIIENPQYKDKPVLICMDSLAQMSTEQEVEADYEHNMNMSLRKAQQLGKALRKIVPFLNKANACLIIINQQRDKPGVMFGDPKTTPGGNALKFAASLRIKLKGAQPVVLLDPHVQAQYEAAIEKYEDDVQKWTANGKVGAKPIKPKKDDFKGDRITVGYDVEAFTVKNKVAPPKRSANFRIMFGQGIVEEEAWFDYALKFGIVHKVGKQYEFIGIRNDAGKFDRDSWLEVLSDLELREKVKDQIVEKMIRPLDAGIPVATVDETADQE